MRRFRILSLDGGGVKGTFTASFLAELERMTGKRVADYFDLITGTSTGGIIAIALGLGVGTEEILGFYERDGPAIFPSTGVRRRARDSVRHLLRPKHSGQVLRAAIGAVLADRRFGESRVRLVITSYDAIRGSLHLFKTSHDERFKQDYRLPAADVAMATAAAPTYFPAFHGTSGLTHVDGGIWANCPAMVGLVEAVGILGYRPREVDILSVGTTTEPFSISRRRRSGGLLLWNKGIADLLMQAQVAGALAQAKVLMGRRPYRVDEAAEPGRFALDDANQIGDLKALGISAARHREEDVSARFLDAPAPAFTPIYPTGPPRQPGPMTPA